MSPSSKLPLSRRYAVVIVLCALPLVLLVAGLAFYQFDAHRQAELQALESDISEAKLVVDSVVKEALDHISQLKQQAGDLLGGRVPPSDPGLRALLKPSFPSGSLAAVDFCDPLGSFAGSLSDRRLRWSSTCAPKARAIPRPSRKFPHCGGRSIVDADGADVPLTAMEFELISVLIRHPRQILSRDRLCQLAHNRDLRPGDRSIDIRVTRLGKKIEIDPDQPAILLTVRGEGYVYKPSENARRP